MITRTQNADTHNAHRRQPATASQVFVPCEKRMKCHGHRLKSVHCPLLLRCWVIDTLHNVRPSKGSLVEIGTFKIINLQTAVPVFNICLAEYPLNLRSSRYSAGHTTLFENWNSCLIVCKLIILNPPISTRLPR